MLRLLIFTLAAYSAHGLMCYSGTSLQVDGGTTFSNVTKVNCSADTTTCIKTRISFTGDTHSVLAVQYGCDTKLLCDSKIMTVPSHNNCKVPYDLWIGNICCCTVDGCNTDVRLYPSSSSSTTTPPPTTTTLKIVANNATTAPPTTVGPNTTTSVPATTTTKHTDTTTTMGAATLGLSLLPIAILLRSL